MGNPVPVMAQAPSGFRLVRSYAPLEADGVALELLDDRQQVVRDGRRLRALRVGVHGEDRLAVTIDEVQQRTAQVEAGGRQAENELPLPHPVHRHVDVVPAARSMQPAGGILAACCDDQSLEVEEQIFVGAVVLALRRRSVCETTSSAPRRRWASSSETMPCAASIARWA